MMPITLRDSQKFDEGERIMKKKKKQMIVVNVSEVKTRSGWNGIKPYTRVQTPKTVYSRKGRRKEEIA